VNILLAIDHSTCSEAAVKAVRDRFRPEDTAVRVVHVVDWPHVLPSALAFAEGPAAADHVLAAHGDILKRGHELVARAVSQLREAQFEASAVVVEGDVRHAILEIAAAWPADTILLGSHGRIGLDKLLLGSVSEGVVRNAPCAVEVIRQRPRTPGSVS
jgi:nucleotide-binding universal stress UspA family protein